MGPPPQAALHSEAESLSTLLDRRLTMAVGVS
jgi:hypothetical protein